MRWTHVVMVDRPQRGTPLPRRVNHWRHWAHDLWLLTLGFGAWEIATYLAYGRAFPLRGWASLWLLGGAGAFIGYGFRRERRIRLEVDRLRRAHRASPIPRV